MHFYAMKWPEVLDLPLNTFWLLNRNVSRIQSENDQRLIRLLLTAQSQDRDQVESVLADLKEGIGQPVIYEAQMDKNAISRLKTLVGVKGNGR